MCDNFKGGNEQAPPLKELRRARRALKYRLRSETTDVKVAGQANSVLEGRGKGRQREYDVTCPRGGKEVGM